MAKELLWGGHAELVFRIPDGVVIKRVDDHGVLQTVAYRSGFLPSPGRVVRVQLADR